MLTKNEFTVHFVDTKKTRYLPPKSTHRPTSKLSRGTDAGTSGKTCKLIKLKSINS